LSRPCKISWLWGTRSEGSLLPADRPGSPFNRLTSFAIQRPRSSTYCHPLDHHHTTFVTYQAWSPFGRPSNLSFIFVFASFVQSPKTHCNAICIPRQRKVLARTRCHCAIEQRHSPTTTKFERLVSQLCAGNSHRGPKDATAISHGKKRDLALPFYPTNAFVYTSTHTQQP
jgi:hypothetical protein